MNETDLKAIKELLDQQTDRFEKRMDERFQEQEERFEKRMIQVFNEGFEKVILPHLSELSNKVDLIEDKIGELDSRTGRIERKLDAVVERQDRQSEEIQSIKKFVRMPEGA
jgi:DNA repair ATPase RecN